MYIHMFGRQPTSQNIIRIGHQLNPNTFEIGMKLTSLEIHGLSRLQQDQVQENGRENANVARIFLIEFGHPCADRV